MKYEYSYKKIFSRNSTSDKVQNLPSTYPKVVDKRRVTANVFCKNQTFDDVKVFKDDLIGLPTDGMRFIEVYDESIDKYHLIKVANIEEIEYYKDEWDN